MRPKIDRYKKVPTAVISLKEIVDRLETVSTDISVYLDTIGGELITLSDDDIAEAEDGIGDADDDAEWHIQVRSQARSVVENVDNRYLKLPDHFDIHEWQIIEDFCHSIKDPEISGDLDRAIRGEGAFRRFKSCLERHGLHAQWFSHREKVLREIAVEWCEENGVAFKESS